MQEQGTHQDWSKNAVMYEVNIRQYTEEGTFSAFMPHLPRLKDLGVGILWLMPVHPVGEMNRKGTLGSYYAVKDFRGVNPEFGTLKELKELVSVAHSLGMKVLLDWVANHAAWDNAWTVTHPEFFHTNDSGQFLSPFDWSDVIALDYGNGEMRAAMIGAMQYWVEETGIDGFRCDMAGLVPTSFWEEARRTLDGVKPVFMLAEDEDNPDLVRNAFDMNYAWKLHHLMNRIARGESKAYEIRDHFHWNDSVFPASVYRLNFITNHDENSWNGSEFERMGEGVKAFAALCYMLPGMPLIYSGQEAGMEKRLQFFEKDAIPWQNPPCQEFYRTLNVIRRDNPALRSGEHGAPLHHLHNDREDAVISFLRECQGNSVMAVLNLSPQPIDVHLSQDYGSGSWFNLMDQRMEELPGTTGLTLDPWDFKLLRKL